MSGAGVTPPRVLVLGGSGFVGRALCERLQAEGWRARVATRRLGHGRVLQHLPALELVQADVFDEAALRQLLTGCDAVVNLVAILHGSPDDFTRVHVELPRRLTAACIASGVRRVLHVSALGVSADAPSHYLRSKAAGEAVLREAGLGLTLLRPSVIFGAGDRFINLFARLQALAPLVPLAGASARLQPVWVEDAAAALLALLKSGDAAPTVCEAAGPTEYSLAQLVRLAGRWSGHPRPIWALPPVLARLQARLMAMAPGEPLMTPDNLDSLQVPNVASGLHPGLTALGIRPSAIEAVAPLYLGSAPGRQRFGRYRAQPR